jgi:hypothetical protein
MCAVVMYLELPKLHPPPILRVAWLFDFINGADETMLVAFAHFEVSFCCSFVNLLWNLID